MLKKLAAQLGWLSSLKRGLLWRWCRRLMSKVSLSVFCHQSGNLLTTPRTYSIEESLSWETDRFSDSPEILCILQNQKVYYRIHKFPPPDPILRQLDQVHSHTSYVLKIHLNIILPSTPGSPKLTLSLTFPHQIPVDASPLPHTRHMSRPSHFGCMCKYFLSYGYIFPG